MNDQYPLAGRMRRLIATMVDAALVPSLAFVLIMIAGVVEDAEDYANNWWVLWVFLLAVLSYLLLNGYGLWRRGQTLGKRLLGIAIVPVAAGAVDDSATGPGTWLATPAPLWKLICVRSLFFPLLFVVIFPPLALLPIFDQVFIFGKNRRCLHDLASGTVVIRLAPSHRNPTP